MAWNDGLAKAPVASMFGMIGAMDLVFGAENWTYEFRGMSASGCLAKITVTTPEGLTIIRECFANQDAPPWDYSVVALMRAYEFLGGKVNWPKEPVKKEEPKAPASAPKPAGTGSARPISTSLPSSYTGPVPYNDSYTNIPPVAFPKPPQEPEWFGHGISGWACWQGKAGKPSSPWKKDMAWREAVHRLVDTPQERDQPLTWIMKLIGKDKQVEPHLRSSHADFIGKAKAACIWAMLAKEQRQGEQESNQDEPDEYASSMVPGEDVPF